MSQTQTFIKIYHSGYLGCMEGIQKQIIDFYEEWQYYCYPDKVEKCRAQVDDFLKLIDKLQEDTNQSNKKQKAKLLYLKGKILDLLPSYQKSSEEFLNKSIKLNPTNGDCWNTLAHVLFKKGDIESSQKAVSMAIENKGNNKVSLRYQSVLLRSQGKNQDEKRQNIEQSLKIIKRAVMLDPKDAVTWYFLGNAYFSNFIANFKKFDELQNAIKAYNEAQRYFKCKYPDLFLNRGNVQLHIQNYQAAINDFLKASEIDKTLGCLQMVEAIKNRLQYTRLAFQRAAELKKSKIEQLLKDIPNKINNNKDNLQIVSIKQLKLRQNPKKLLTGKIINRITNSKDIPHSYLLIDNDGVFFALSLYNIDHTKVNQKLKKDSLVSILNPQAKIVNGQGFQYTSIQLFEPTKLRVDNNWLTKQQFNPSQIRNETFQK